MSIISILIFIFVTYIILVDLTKRFIYNTFIY